MCPERSGFHLEIHPSVVLQLGEQLISDELTAIIELVKNAYDADASYAHIQISTDTRADVGELFFSDQSGRILISDDGTGMDEQDIRRGWLLISDSPKKREKQAGRVTPLFRRTPLGDKGLGRLGAQRLGDTVEFFTKKTNIYRNSGAKEPTKVVSDEAFHIGIDWSSLQSAERLSDVPVRVASARDSSSAGTRIYVSGLKNLQMWQSEAAVTSLQRRLSQLVFPFAQQQTFKILANVNGRSLDIQGIAGAVREFATASFDFEYSDGVLRVDGKLAPVIVRGQSGDDLQVYEKLIASDDGSAFTEYLMGRNVSERHKIKYEPESRWCWKTTYTRTLDSIQGSLVSQHPADPGPFTGSIDLYDFGAPTQKEFASRSLGRISEVVQQQRGVRVFRDGFAIRPYGLGGDDWLGLGQRQTSGKSYYGLRPANVIGFVSVSAEHNAQLSEKTDREGFVENPYSKNFLGLMDRVVENCNEVIQSVRREFTGYKPHRARSLFGLSPTPDATESIERLRSAANEGAIIQRESEIAERGLRALYLERSDALRPDGDVNLNQQMGESTSHRYECSPNRSGLCG